MLFFFEEEQLDNGSATTSQKEFPKDRNRRYTKFPVNVANFILVKQVFGLTKERTNTNMQSKNVTSAIVLLLTSLKQVTQLNGMILLSLMDTNTKKNRRIKESLYISAFSTGRDATGQLLNLEAGTYIDQTWNSLNPMIRKFALTNSDHPT